MKKVYKVKKASIHICIKICPQTHSSKGSAKNGKGICHSLAKQICPCRNFYEAVSIAITKKVKDFAQPNSSCYDVKCEFLRENR